MLSTATPDAPAAAPRPESLPAQIDLDLVKRFDKLGPRYTSYPTADRFVEAYDEQSYRQAMRTRLIGPVRQPLSLYVHLPFCNTICFYCGCNKVVTRDKSRAARYLHYLGLEVGMQAGLAGEEKRVRQMHWGGGTPTFLSDHELRLVWEMLRSNFDFDRTASTPSRWTRGPVPRKRYACSRNSASTARASACRTSTRPCSAR